MAEDPEPTIRRGHHNRDFTVTPNAAARDNRLTPEAGGILWHLLSLPPNWELHPRALAAERKIGRDKVYRIIRELRQAGYMERVEERDSRQRITRYVYIVRDVPVPGKPDTAEPDTENQDTRKNRGEERTESTVQASPADVPTLCVVGQEQQQGSRTVTSQTLLAEYCDRQRKRPEKAGLFARNIKVLLNDEHVPVAIIRAALDKTPPDNPWALLDHAHALLAARRQPVPAGPTWQPAVPQGPPVDLEHWEPPPDAADAIARLLAKGQS